MRQFNRVESRFRKRHFRQRLSVHCITRLFVLYPVAWANWSIAFVHPFEHLFTDAIKGLVHIDVLFSTCLHVCHFIFRCHSQCILVSYSPLFDQIWLITHHEYWYRVPTDLQRLHHPLLYVLKSLRPCQVKTNNQSTCLLKERLCETHVALLPCWVPKEHLVLHSRILAQWHRFAYVINADRR